MIRTHVSVVVCCAGLLAALQVHAQPSDRAADAAVIDEWMRVVDSATVVTVRHELDLLRPAHFKSTRKPCAYLLNEIAAEKDFGGGSPARFAAQLGLGARFPDPDSCRQRVCLVRSSRLWGPSADTLRSQTLELTFRRLEREVTFSIRAGEGLARIRDRSDRWACLPLADRMPGLVALARIAFPDDSLLATFEACDSIPSNGGLPGFGEFVYVEELPEATERRAPDYPNPARAAGASGIVIIQALVGKDGKVVRTSIVQSIPLLDEAAVQAVEHWRFRPAKAGGKPMAVWVAIPVKFTLRD